jgi:hypothetical protein
MPLEALRRITKNLMVACIEAEIRTGHPPNTVIELDHHNKLHGVNRN